MAQRTMMVSACLAGVNCVYDGSHNRQSHFAGLLHDGEVFLFCPEVLGGMRIPHPPSEIRGGDGFAVLEGRARVVSRDGRDVTEFFLLGARKTLAFARKHGVKTAVMKAKSPSCGCGKIYDGTFTKTLIPGFGVTAALLKQNGIEVVSDEEYLSVVKTEE
ncbi:purine nucleoside phosphorylase [Candidatus Velamenicoccus archaeovorus]|uniref:Purine nucleoside phosphorylase n=1 Tax=Velamenicoccus archaeovorus TaxID=1930593 RepID=A0A410P3N9_VELA1|nr:DUF523 domain-containing protein [Candidatus Velamenicoccus archaeovorus]QAT16614.1 purine nucleoside phosphorylase [Candidatus Velamenicoccus archaeovorus]